MAFKICFLIRVISKINNKGNWAHLAELNQIEDQKLRSL